MKLKTISRAAAIALTVLSVAVGAAATASASTFPILYVNAEPNAAVSCVNLGNDGKTQAVACVYLYALQLEGDPTAGASVVTVYCATLSGVDVTCANIHVEQTIAAPNNYGVLTVTSACGHADGPCEPKYPGNDYINSFPGDNLNILASDASQPACTVPTASSSQWAVLDAAGTNVELPGSDKLVSLSSNLSTGHYSICL